MFYSPAKMLAFAGMEPSFYQSGTFTIYGRMVKRGSPYLRYTIMNCTEMLIIHNHNFYTYYHKKRDEGKVHRVALIYVARKLIRVIYKLETSKTNFDINLLK